MSPPVNLLPQSYRQAQARRRRIRMGMAVAGMALGAELLVGMILYTRGARTRELLDAAATARASTEVIFQKMKAPAAESALLSQQLTLARKLRTTHHWSRLLNLLAQAASPRVVLTTVSTDPPRWSPNLGTAEIGLTPVKAGQPARNLLEGLNVQGRAADYEDLTEFISNLQNAGAFASLNLLQARRDAYLEHDVISFELQCRW